MNLSVFKTLPTFFDVQGWAEYFMGSPVLPAEFRSYSVGFLFHSKPRSCWGFSLMTGRDTYKKAFINFTFNFDFGQATALTESSK